MDEEIVRRGIPRLNKEQKDIIYHRCTRGLSTDQLIVELDTNRNTLNRNLRRIYDTLWIDGISDMTPDFCRIFHEVAGEPPYTDPANIVREIEDEEESPPPLPPAHLPRRENGPTPWSRVATGILVLLFIVGFWRAVQVIAFECPILSADLLCPLNQPAVAVEPEPQPDEVAQPVVPGEEPTPEPEGELTPVPPPTATATETPTITPSPTSTNTPTITPMPTETPAPSDTPTPSVTPTATATREWPIEIDANFSAPLDDNLWTIRGPQPSYLNGEMAVTPNEHDPLILSMGDETWKNYTVELAFRAVNCFPQWTNIIGVRLQDPGNMIGFHYNGCGTGMYLWKNGRSEPVLNTDSDIDPQHIRIQVSDTNILIFVNGAQQINYTVTDADYSSGGVFLSMKSGTFDYIRINRNE